MRKLVALLIIFSFSTLAMAQSEQIVKFGIGPKIGIGFNGLGEEYGGVSVQESLNKLFVGSDISATAFNVGFLYGAFTNIMFAERIGVQVEFLGSGEGTGIKFTEKSTGKSFSDGDFDYTKRFKMTNIPILLQVHIKDGIKVYGGVQISSLNKATTRVGTPSASNKAVVMSDSALADINTSWVSVPIGASYEVEGFVVDLRMTIGPEIGKNPSVYSATPFSLQLGIGYNFGVLFNKPTSSIQE